MAQFIGTISKVTGAVYVQAADGSRRPVKVGDDLFQGDLLVRSDGSVVEVSFADSTPLVMTGSGELLISAELIEDGRNTTADSALFDETLDAVVAALEGEGDLLDELEATAAGGVGNEGSSFVRLGRIGYGLEELILRVAASQGQQVSPENADFDNDLQLLQPVDVEPVTPPIVTAPPETPPPEPPVTPPPENGPPDAVDDTTVTDYQTPVNVTVLGNDSDPDGDALTVVDNSEPSNGSAVLNEDGTFTYTPDDGFTGTDSFTYTITDGNGGEDTATVTIEVGEAPPPPPPLPPENGPPDAVDDTTVTDYQTSVKVTVLGNDSDPDGDALTVVDNSEPSNGSAVLNEDGTFTYTPDDGFTGTDSFTYTITDGNGGEDTATVTIEVGGAPPPPPPPPENGPPDAVDDTTVTDYQTPVNVTVLGNDSDPDGDALTVVDNSEPSNGSAVLNEDGTFTYTPDDGFTGTDSFTYTITDGNGGEDTATVTIEVGEAPPPPPPVEAVVELSGDASVVEADGALLEHTISLVDQNGAPVVLGAGETIELSLSYGAIVDVDGIESEDLSTQQVTITLTGNGSDSSFTVSNVVADDALAEVTEGYTVSIASVDGGTNSFGSVTVSETVNSGEGRITEETYTLQLFAVVDGEYVSANEIEETGGVGTYVVLAVDSNGDPLSSQPGGTVDVAVADGTATRTDDYSTDATRTVTVGITFTIAAVSDDVDEPNETFTLSLNEGTWSRDSEFDGVVYQGGVETTILDDDEPAVYVQLSGDASVVEADGALLEHTISLVDQNGAPVVLGAGETIELSLSYGAIVDVDGIESEDLSTQQVTITLTGNGSDSSFTVSNVVADDALAEVTEGYTVSIASVDGGTNSFGSVTVSETVNSGEGRITEETYTLQLFAVVDGEYVSANEIEETGGVGTYVVLAVDSNGDPLSSQPGGTVDVAVADGTATRTDDYSTDATRTVTVGITFTIAAVSDDVDEPNETFTLSLNEGTWSRDSEFDGVVYQGGVETTILDDDTPPDFSDVGSWFFSGTADQGGVNTIRVNEDAPGNDGNVATLGVQFNTGNKDGGGSGGTDELPDGAVITVYIEITDDSLVNASLSFGASKNGNKVSGHSAEIQTIDGTQYIVVTMYPEDDAKLNDLNFTLEIVAGEDDVAGSGTMTIDISHATITLSEADGGGTYDFGDAIEDKDDVHIEYVDSDAPIAVDLDGDGVEYINIDSGVVFTDQATGESVSTAWVAPDDGMLVIDANNSGTVDETREYVFTEWSETAETDLQAVAEVFDTNQDGVLDAQDEQWDQFAIWQDADSDGVTDEGELVPLSELGIESISLTYNEDSESGTAADGDVVIHGQSTVTFTDGSTTIAEDASFVVSAGDVLSDDDTVEIPAAGEDGQAATSQESTASQTGGERSGYDADLLEADLMTSGNSTEKLDTPEQ